MKIDENRRKSIKIDENQKVSKLFQELRQKCKSAKRYKPAVLGSGGEMIYVSSPTMTMIWVEMVLLQIVLWEN